MPVLPLLVASLFVTRAQDMPGPLECTVAGDVAYKRMRELPEGVRFFLDKMADADEPWKASDTIVSVVGFTVPRRQFVAACKRGDMIRMQYRVGGDEGERIDVRLFVLSNGKWASVVR
ncbi:hypothetical protein P1X14_05465 [Sphingomonas sp. AOB5]|uniref:hypothetical protein n=1 Tax=Sphingomonas sp. AOB5 TaxID=3034017 RepID=UPI0023F9F2DC|nr:hypothetical protein [Sphingomonas sp. AOB5]MDF7774688.1 hypothetical protein [Sphingomonas sp. AOB5]